MVKKPTYEELEQRVKELEKDSIVHRQIEEALRESEERFRTLIEQSPIAIQVMTPDGRIVQINDAYVKLWGISLNDLSEFNILQDKQAREIGVMPYIEKAFSGKASLLPDIQYDAKKTVQKGRKPWIRSHLYPVKDEKGEIQNVVMMYEDLTERKRAEEALRENEGKYRPLFEHSRDAIVFTNQRGEVIDVNPAAMELFGYTKEEMFKMNFQKVYVRPDEGCRFQKEMEENGSVQNFETRLLANGSVEMDCTLDVVCRQGDDGSILEYQGIIRDISEAKRTQGALKASQQRLSQIINFLPDATMVIDLEGEVIAWNQAIENLTGIKALEMLGKGNYEYAIPFYGERRPVLIDIVGKWNEEIEKKYQYIKKEGESLVSETYDSLIKPGGFLWNRASLLYDHNGKVIGAIESIRDITDRKVAEAALKESEAKFRSLAENQHDVVWTVNENLDIDYISPSCFKMTGTTAEKTMGMNPKDFYTEESYQRIILKLAEERQRSANEMQPAVLEVDQYHEDGHLFPVEITCTPIIIDNKFIGVQGISRDITEKKKAEEALRESEEKFKYLVKNSNDVFVIINENAKEIFVSDSVEDITGFTPAETMEHSGFEFLHPNDLDHMSKTLSKLLETPGGTIREEYRHRRKDGGWVYLEAIGTNYLHEPSVQGVVLNIRDITERRQTEKRLLESEKKFSALHEKSRKAEEVYRSLFHTSADAILIYDLDGKVDYLSPTFTTIFGWTLEELKGKRLHFLPESEKKESMARIKQLIKDGKSIQGFETKRYSKNGSLINVSLSGSRFNDAMGNPAGLLVLIRDTSERTKLETRLHQAQKMEAIGTLAGGVAHDLNNILGGLVSYPELLLLQLPEDSPLRKPIFTIQKSGQKAAAVVQDLLTLARRGVVTTEVVNLDTIIDEYLQSPEHENLQAYHPGVHIETHLEKDTLNILGSPAHLSKTVMNLVSNAAEAMPEGGTLSVSMENRYIDRPIRGYDNVKEGDYVVLTISDTGIGISPEDMGKIFEPFYTKKKMGRSGTGLGMAVVWGTVKDHNGYIHVWSTEGKGTTFTLYFPVTRKSLEVRAETFLEDYMGKGETILVVDDVKEQRNIASGMLEELGYSVVSVSGGEEAVEYLKTNKADLLLLDMIMDPGMDGLDTYRKILEMHSEQKAIITSGFSETDRARKLQHLGAGAYIRKPFLLEKIGIAIKEELEK